MRLDLQHSVRSLALTSVVVFLFLPLAAFALDGIDAQSAAEVQAAREQIAKEFGNAIQPGEVSAFQASSILKNYNYLDPKHEIPNDLLEKAVVYFDANKAKFKNQNFITVVDFKPRSDQFRFFLIDLKTGEVEKFHTTHGAGSVSSGSDEGYATSFGNVIDSGKSSLGFVRTAEVYTGTYHRALRLDGISSTNSNLRERAIVFHGWDGVKEQNQIQGLTLGCIALDWVIKDAVLDKIKNGSLMLVGVAN